MATLTPFCLIILLCLVARSQATSSNSSNTQLINQILSYMNNSTSPCDDYFKHACGMWGARHGKEDILEITGVIEDKVNRNLVTLMEELQKRSLEPESVEAKVLSFYQTCRQGAQSKRLNQHYLELVPPNEQIPWPQFIPKPAVWATRKFQWMETLAHLRRYGLTNVLFKMNVMANPLNSSQYIIHIDRPSFEEMHERLFGTIITKWTLMTLGVRRNTALDLARKVKNLESAVRTLAEAGSDDSDTELLSLRQLEQLTGGKWRKYLETVLGHTVPADYELYVDNAVYIAVLVRLLERWDRKVLATYIMLRFVSHVIEESMVDQEPIACVQEVRRNMEQAANLLYEQRFIGPSKLRQLRAEVLALFELLRKQFIHNLDENHLRLEQVQIEALRAKMMSMRLNIGNMPQNANHSQFVAQFYADVHMSEDRDHARNHLRLLEFRTRRELELLERPAANASDYFYMADSDTAMSSTPYYMIRQNIIIVPFGVLQEPVFQQGAHDIFKVSLLGFVLSHELVHGFDSTGLLYNARGSVHELGAQIKQSDQYTEALQCLNRNKTAYLDEREADIAGIRLAYDLYFGAGSKFNQTQPSFTQVPLKQLFFLNMAQFFCGKSTADDIRDHDTDQLRLHQLLINFPAFAEAHNCRLDIDNMHPAQKCRTW